MNNSIRMLVACLALLLAPAVLAQGAKATKAQGKTPIRWAAHAILMGPPVECADDDSQCDVPVTMKQGTVDGLTVCLARVAAEIKVKKRGGFPPTKKIAWNLTPPNMSGFEFSFQDKNGILVIEDPETQLQPGNIGASNAQFVVKNKRKKTNNAIYLPIIVQTETATGVVTLCAAADPKIVNE